MKITTDIEQYTIDASGKKLGRVATEAAVILMGKNRTDVTRNNLAPVAVSIKHASKLDLSEQKRHETKYDRYSGYPDGRRELSMQQLIDKKGTVEVVRKAVYGMLPGNKLRARRMKQLTVSE